ncbi:methyltransferase domain-containing protein [Anthocerotibacter panamensis]|uniref:methyltransferase domain-containing protein n=1 Tax=Anthocerotibacter panamensis TaxID=2857077 RepID=UPI001C40210B|nr:methyltransferase domain-containing protein [Anthocerotibacter panamensis]
MPPVETAAYWEERYRSGTTRWDLGEAAPPFRLLLEGAQAPPAGHLAVLGCGRGYDALLFAQRGFTVLGFDFAPAAVEAATALAKRSGSSAHFFERNIFDLPQEFAGAFDYVLEHTCFCAIDPLRRPDYVHLVHTLLKPGGKLMGLFFTHNRSGGPPYGTTPEEVRALFIPKFEVLTLELTPHSVAERRGEEHLGYFLAR